MPVALTQGSARVKNESGKEILAEKEGFEPSIR